MHGRRTRFYVMKRLLGAKALSQGVIPVVVRVF